MTESWLCQNSGKIQGKPKCPDFPHGYKESGPIQGIREKMAFLYTPRKSFPVSLNPENAPIFRMVTRKTLRENVSLSFPEFPESR